MKRRMSIWIAVFAVAAALGVYLVAIAQTGESAYQTIKPEETRRRFENGGNGLYVDVRTQAEYDEAHIPGALLLPLDRDWGCPPATLADFERELYVYCRTGVRSREASEKLLALGYQNVYDMGGIVSWPYEKVSTAEEQAVAQPEQTRARRGPRGNARNGGSGWGPALSGKLHRDRPRRQRGGSEPV